MAVTPSRFAFRYHFFAACLGLGALIEKAAAFGAGLPGLGLGIGFSCPPTLSFTLLGYHILITPWLGLLSVEGAEGPIFQQAAESEDGPLDDTRTVRRSGLFAAWLCLCGRQLLFCSR
jgi:hypothetical protein